MWRDCRSYVLEEPRSDGIHTQVNKGATASFSIVTGQKAECMGTEACRFVERWGELMEALSGLFYSVSEIGSKGIL